VRDGDEWVIDGGSDETMLHYLAEQLGF